MKLDTQFGSRRGERPFAGGGKAFNPIRLLLLIILAVLIIAMAAWQQIGHFDVDDRGFAVSLALLPAPLGLWLFYSYVRPDENVAAAMFGLSYMVLFGPAISVFSYFCLSVIGARIDDALAAADRLIGFDWPNAMAFVSRHYALRSILSFVYKVSIWQVLVTIILLGWLGRDGREADGLCLSIAFCGIATVAVWAIAPSIGAVAVYRLPHAVEAGVGAPLNSEYARAVLALYAHAPAQIHSGEMRGLVGFPSFHTEEAVVTTWFLRGLRPVFIAALIFNFFTLIACPIDGGHHMIDVLGGAALAVACIVAAAKISSRYQPRGS